MKQYESHQRSILKAVTFRICVLIADFVIISRLTNRYDVALSVVLISNFSSTILYFLHERFWNRVRWGIKSGKKL